MNQRTMKRMTLSMLLALTAFSAEAQTTGTTCYYKPERCAEVATARARQEAERQIAESLAGVGDLPRSQAYKLARECTGRGDCAATIQRMAAVQAANLAAVKVATSTGLSIGSARALIRGCADSGDRCEDVAMYQASQYALRQSQSLAARYTGLGKLAARRLILSCTESSDRCETEAIRQVKRVAENRIVQELARTSFMGYRLPRPRAAYLVRQCMISGDACENAAATIATEFLALKAQEYIAINAGIRRSDINNTANSLRAFKQLFLSFMR